MASGDRSSFLEIPGAWISQELDLDLSLPASLTPPSSKQTAYIGTSLGWSSNPPPSCDPPPSSTASVVHSTPRASYDPLGNGTCDHRVKRATFPMYFAPKIAEEASPQSTLSLFHDTPLHSPIDAPPFPLPREPTRTSSGDTSSIYSGVTGLTFDPPVSPSSKCNSDFGFPTSQEDMARIGFASRESLNYSVIDACPSPASINIITSIPSIASDLQLHNFLISDEQPIERHSAYFSVAEDIDNFSVSQRSDEEVEPAHEASTSSGSDSYIPSAEEAHHQIFWQENPAPRRPTVRVEVRSNVLQSHGEGTMRQESFAYACESLPYDAGLRPHAYVDNQEHTTHGKHHLEAIPEDVRSMDEFMEDHVADKSKRPTIFRRLVQGKKISKLIAFGPLKSQKPPNRFSVDSRATSLQSQAVSSSTTNSAYHNSGTSNHSNRPGCSPSLTPSSSPPPYAVLPKKRHRPIFRRTWSGPRPLSMFVIPKPGIEGKLTPSPRELSTCLPVDVNPPPLSPPTSPEMQSAQISEDIHGRSYGPSRLVNWDIV